ncbi:DUF5819 family protein [Streptomyces sp. NPDC020490]|uniref:DUF5819 family protein n=1 Tax=Streptomyces sp. NPDC020490 TaxID=3365078 RepID=UPI0037983BE8
MEPPRKSAAVHPVGEAASGTHCLPPPRPGTEEGGPVPPGFVTARARVRGGEPAPGAVSAPDRPWSRLSVALLTATAMVLAAALLVHLAMIFLTLAPTNVLKTRDQEVINSYVQPEFGQDWKLFAPNPKQRNDAIGVRLRTTGARGARHVSEWINLTDQDVAAIKGALAPSHVNQNMLRLAWDNSEALHGPGDRPTGIRGVVAGAYLKRVVLQRVGHRWRGEPVTAVQIAGRYTMVPPPSWTGEETPDTTTYRVLPWWPVTDQDYKGL